MKILIIAIIGLLTSAGMTVLTSDKTIVTISWGTDMTEFNQFTDEDLADAYHWCDGDLKPEIEAEAERRQEAETPLPIDEVCNAQATI